MTKKEAIALLHACLSAMKESQRIAGITDWREFIRALEKRLSDKDGL